MGDFKMRFSVYYTYMFGRALWKSGLTAEQAFKEAELCRRRYQHVEIKEEP